MPMASNSTQVPLAVDLDGTLIRTDMMWESVALLLKKNPFILLAFPIWLLGGRAHLKQQLSRHVQVNPAALPYHTKFLEWLKEEKSNGRKLVLATASDIKMAEPVAAHVGIFDEVLASDGKTNLRSTAKMKKLTERFGERGFDYAGNSSVDLGVWAGTREAIVVNADDSLAQRAARQTKIGRTFPSSDSLWRELVRALRPHQWTKNLIIFVPLLTAHKIGEKALLLNAIFGFVAFSLCASGVYVLNDLIDLDADRHHAIKRNRPFASGALPLQVGLVLVPLLVVGAGLLAWQLTGAFAAVLVLYLMMTTAYSCRLKSVALLDVFILAALYTLRLIAGHTATGVAYSAWLLIFSMFTFLSLALLKRFIELRAVRLQNLSEVRGRGYTPGDLELIATFGLVSGCVAVLVLALYVNSEQVTRLYKNPTALLLVCPLLLYWMARVWFLAHRGQMHDDPTEFAFKDWISYLIGGLTLGVMWLATGR
jgi:4-hydroxybenzoate polyprenyltransferase